MRWRELKNAPMPVKLAGGMIITACGVMGIVVGILVFHADPLKSLLAFLLSVYAGRQMLGLAVRYVRWFQPANQEEDMEMKPWER